jgi:hypothetical protein
MAIGLAAFALQNLADFTAFLPSLLWIACILRGVVAASNEPADRLQAGPGGRVLSGASLVVAFVSILVVACTGVAENARMASRFAAFQGDAGRAERLARRAVIWAPWSPDAALLFARTAMLGTQPTPPDSEQLVEALDRVERAVRLSPVRPAARELRSQLRLLSGDFPGALADMIAASRLYPHNREYAQRRNELEVFVREAIDRAESGDAEVH